MESERKKKRVPLRLMSILVILTASIIVTTLGVSGVNSFQMFEKLMVQKIANSRVDVLTQVSEKLTTIKSNVQLLSNLYYYNANVAQLYRGEAFSEDEEASIIRNFKSLEEVSRTTQSTTGLEFYYTFVLDNGFTYCSDPYHQVQPLEEYRGKMWFQEVVEQKEKWISTDVDSQGKSVITFARSIRDEAGAFIGLCLFNIYEENVSQVFANLTDENDIYIVDSSGNIVSHMNKELIGIRFYDMDIMDEMFSDGNYNLIRKNQEQYLFSIFKNQELDWILVEEIPMEILWGDVNYVRSQMLLVGMVIFAVSMLICLYIARKTTRPLKELVRDLEEVGKSEHSGQLFAVEGWQEINTISEECNYMNQRITGLLAEIKETEQKKRAAELGFMQSQMRPHFLYNTLFSIRCLVDMGDKQNAIRIIDSFSAILKYILSYQNEYVEVAQEIKFLEDYGVLQKCRYGEQFQLDIECPTELYQNKLLRMILEPLVENSLFHGLSDDQEQIRIKICFETDGSDMIITVTDDGIGFTDQGYLELGRKIRAGEQSNLIGMNNIRDRIKMNFGKKYGLSIDMNYQNGARVIVKIPLIH